MRDIPLLLVLVALVPFVISRPYIGVLLWGWAALFMPNFFVYGIASSVRFNMIIAILTAISYFCSRESKALPANSVTILLFVFLLHGTISAFSTIAFEPMVMGEWGKFIKVIIYTLAILAVINSRHRIHSLLIVFVLSLGFHGILEGSKFLLTFGAHRVWGPVGSIIGDNNHLALAMVMLLPVVAYLCKYSEKQIVRISFMVVFGLLLTAVLGTYSRGGLIGLTTILFLLALRSEKRVLIIFVIAPLTLVMAMSFLPDAWFSRMDTIQSADEDASFMGRVIAWKMSALIAMDHPFFGGGFHAVQDNAVWFDYMQVFSRLSYIPTPDPDPIMAHAAHSIYFQVLGDQGFLGLFIFLLLLFCAMNNLRKTMILTKKKPEYAWAYDLALVLNMSLLAYMVTGAALGMAYFDFAYALIAISVVLLSVIKAGVVEKKESWLQK